MKAALREKITHIVENKLSKEEINELIGFIRQAMDYDLNQDDESFFRKLAYDMTGEVKDLALMIIDFRRDLQTKIHPEITELTTKYIPQATDQLAGVIETTELAANKIMDNLENMQAQTEKIKDILTTLKGGKMILPGEKKEAAPTEIDSRAIEPISPLIDYMESVNKNYLSLISDTFVQMSFQDLTGQRIRRIMDLVGQMEERLKSMVISFGIQLSEWEKNPEVSSEDLRKAVDEKVDELSGPQRDGHGLDQAGIDDLLMNM